MGKVAKRGQKAMKYSDVSHAKYVAVLVIAVAFVGVLAASNMGTNTTGFIVADTNVVEKQTLPPKVVDCDQSDPLNIYEKIVSNGDGTVTIYSYNACYPGCTGISTYEVKTRNVLSQETKCIREK